MRATRPVEGYPKDGDTSSANKHIAREIYKTQNLISDSEYIIDKRIEHHLNKHWLRVAAVVIASNAVTIMVLGVLG